MATTCLLLTASIIKAKIFNACLEASVAELARKHPKGFYVRAITRTR